METSVSKKHMSPSSDPVSMKDRLCGWNRTCVTNHDKRSSRAQAQQQQRTQTGNAEIFSD